MRISKLSENPANILKAHITPQTGKYELAQNNTLTTTQVPPKYTFRNDLHIDGDTSLSEMGLGIGIAFGLAYLARLAYRIKNPRKYVKD